MPRRKHSPPPDPLSRQILEAVQGRPLDKNQLAREIGLSPAQKRTLRGRLEQMEQAGELIRIRRDRYALPEDTDVVIGKIQFRSGGSAYLLPSRAGDAELDIAAEDTGTAMHGDLVAVRLEKTTAWRRGKQCARVLRILERSSDTLVGTLQKSRSFYYVVADDPRFIHNLYVDPPVGPGGARVGDTVVAKFEAWESRHINPEGKIIEVLGPRDNPEVELLAILRKYHLPVEFPVAVEEQALRVTTNISKAEAARRDDRRNNFVFTIDPDDARDFDDAIEIKRTKSGWELGVHIADVSHYVRPGSALEKEARSRGNSTYLPDRVIPMLPVALSNGICSLRPDEDRLTFSVFATFGRKGNVTSCRFAKAVIRSCARLTYGEALERLEKPPGDILSEHLHEAWKLASTLRQRRFRSGALDLDFPEIKVRVDAEGRPVDLQQLENDISHQLIEEFMLFANEMVARELRQQRQPTVYRIHEDPDQERLDEFRETVLSFGLPCGDVTQRHELQSVLDRVKGKPFEGAVKIALLKSLKRARYASEAVGHYGLQKKDYTHFTSPIRRYADLIVHRSLERELGLSKRGPDSRDLPAIAEHISATERNSADAERESVKLKKIDFFQRQLDEKTGRTFRAQVIEARNYGVFVDLPDCNFSGLIHLSSIEDDFFQMDAGRRRVVGRGGNRAFSVGDMLEVMVSRVDRFKQQVDFTPVTQPKQEARKPSRKQPKRKPKDRKPSRTNRQGRRRRR